jgi:hypothetical protein
MRIRRASVAILHVAIIACGVPVSALQVGEADEPARRSWVITPSVAAGAVWDDNVLIQGRADQPSQDETTLLTPSLQVNWAANRSTFSAGYTGSLSTYQSFAPLNSYEQTASVDASRRVTKRTTLRASQSYLSLPTTNLDTLAGTPFLRLGSRVANLSVQSESAVSSRTTATAGYTFQLVRFDKREQDVSLLAGGSSHGGGLGLRRRVSGRTTVAAEYDLVVASLIAGRYSIQHGWFSAEYRLTPLLHVLGGIAAARIESPDLMQARLQPAWRAGIVRAFRTGGFEAGYGRTFVPSYASANTQASDELTLSVRLPLGRRLYAEQHLAWRRDQSIIDVAPPLTSVWVNAALGWRARRWARVEVFYDGFRQRIGRPGGAIDRNRIGLQVATSTLLRLR